MMDLTSRQLTLLIAFPVVIAIFIILGYLVLRKDPKYWGNRCFALFFWITASTLALNLSFILSTNDLFIIHMNIITIETANLSIVAVLLGILVIYRGEGEILHDKKIFLFLGLIAVLIIIQICIPAAIYVVDFDARWTTPFALYELCYSQGLMLATYYFSLKFYWELSADIRKRFLLYLVGLTILDLTLVTVTIDNWYIFGAGFQTIASIVNLSIILAAILIYFGIVRRN